MRAGSQQGASASGGDLAIMLVVEVYNKAEWEINAEDAESRGRKSIHPKLRQDLDGLLLIRYRGRASD